MPEYSLLDRPFRPPAHYRSPGVHLSDVIHDLAVRQRMYVPGDEQWEAMALGSAVEYARVAQLEQEDPEGWTRLGSFSIDGIEVTPDLYNLRALRPWECKATAMGLNVGPGHPKLWRFEMQLGGYCHACAQLFEEPCLSGELEVIYFRGDYTADKLVGYKPWLVTWTEREIAHQWTAILTHRDVMMFQGWAPGKVLVEHKPGDWDYLEEEEVEAL